MTIYLTPPVSGGGGGAVASGTTTTEGTVRLATTTEAQDVNNETLAVTPKGLNAQISAAVAGGVTYQGVIAGDSIPTLTSANQGDLYKISVASTGVVAGFNWAVNDNLLINADMGGTFDAAKVNKIDSTDSDLATVATSGSYNDLTNKPSIPSASTDLTDTASLVRTADLATVATTGAYSDLTGQPTNLSQFNNDQNYITSVASASETVAGIIEVATDGEATAAAATDKALVPSNIPHIALSSFDDDLTYLSSVDSASTTTAGIIEIADATETSAGTSNALAVSPLGLATEIGNLASTDLSDGADLLKTSDKGTTISDVVEVVDVGNSVAGISALDGRNLTNLTYANITGTPSLATVATSGSYDDLSNKPTSDDITSDHEGVNYTGALNASITTHLSGIDSALASAGASGYPVQTAIGGLDETGTGGSDNSTGAALNTALVLTALGSNDVEVKLPLISTASDGDVVIILRSRAGNLKITKNDNETVSTPITYLDQTPANSVTITNNQQQIHVRFDSASQGRWFIFDKAQAVVATSGSYNDLSNKPTSDDLTSDHEGVNYTGALNASITTHLSGIDSKFGTLGTASTNASTDFLSATGADSLGGNLDTNSHEIVTSANNDNITLRPNGTGWVKIGGNTNPGEVRLYCETSDQHWVGLKSPTHSDFGSNPSVTIQVTL